MIHQNLFIVADGDLAAGGLTGSGVETLTSRSHLKMMMMMILMMTG